MDGTSGTSGQSFAAYLAQAFIAKKGYQFGIVREARELLAHCDFAITFADGMALSIICFVDREVNPSQRFSLSQEELDRIGRDCLQYAGNAVSRPPVHITIVEVGAVPPEPADIARLKLLASRSLFSKVQIAAMAVTPSLQQCWTNAPIRMRSVRRFIQQLMSKPRLGDADLVPQPHPVLPEERPMTLTYGLMALLLAVFASEYVFRIGSQAGSAWPSIGTLTALGALAKSLVLDDGQWWRLFTAPLLHGGFVHIAFNGAALFFAGAVLESVIGRAWFAGIFALSAVTGSAMSLAINPDALISVGASGAIMGLFAAAFAVGFRYPAGSPMRSYLLSGSLRVLIPSMLPLFGGLAGERIDYAAHLGGGLGGAAAGALLVLIWGRERVLPPLRPLAWALAAAFVCCAAYGGIQAAKGYESYELSTGLIPAEALPDDVHAAQAKSAELVAKYPGDPRSHMYRALALSDAGDDGGAEREWRAALADGKTLHAFFKPELEMFIRAKLAEILQANGKKAEALETARSVCGGKGEIRDALAKEGLCP